MTETQTIAWFFQQFGFPGSIVAVNAVFLYRVAKWVKPYVESVFLEHLALIKQARNSIAALPSKEELPSKAQIIEISKDVDQLLVKVKSDGKLLAQVHKKVVGHDLILPDDSRG